MRTKNPEQLRKKSARNSDMIRNTLLKVLSGRWKFLQNWPACSLAWTVCHTEHHAFCWGWVLQSVLCHQSEYRGSLVPWQRWRAESGTEVEQATPGCSVEEVSLKTNFLTWSCFPVICHFLLKQSEQQSNFLNMKSWLPVYHYLTGRSSGLQQYREGQGIILSKRSILKVLSEAVIFN